MRFFDLGSLLPFRS